MSYFTTQDVGIYANPTFETITRVGINESIETAVTNATAGDTLLLASGTYTITDDIDITKDINIVGQGVSKTTISCATASKNLFDISGSNDVRLSDMSISGGAASDICIKAGTGVTLNVENCYIYCIGNRAIELTDAAGCMWNCKVMAYSSGATTYGIYYTNAATLRTFHIHNSSLISQTTDAEDAIGLYVYDSGAPIGDIKASLYNTNVVAISGGGGATNAYGVYANGADAFAYIYNCLITASGGAATNYSAIQATTATFEVYGTELANGFSGTIIGKIEPFTIKPKEFYLEYSVGAADVEVNYDTTENAGRVYVECSANTDATILWADWIVPTNFLGWPEDGVGNDADICMMYKIDVNTNSTSKVELDLYDAVAIGSTYDDATDRTDGNIDGTTDGTQGLPGDALLDQAEAAVTDPGTGAVWTPGRKVKFKVTCTAVGAGAAVDEFSVFELRGRHYVSK